MLPKPTRTYGRYSPWGRLVEWRRRYDVVLDKLIEDELADPNFEDRTDVLALMLRSTYEDGSTMSRNDIGDELLTLLAAGHETTAATLGWAFERVSRHPDVLAALVAEADAQGNELRQATILEVQRSRTVIDFAGRHVYAPVYRTRRVGDPARVVDPGQHRRACTPTLMSSQTRTVSTRSASSEPNRPASPGFRSAAAPGAAWVRFANMEMDVVLRTVLRHFTIETTTAPGEKWHSRGVAFTPKDGGKIVVHRRPR